MKLDRYERCQRWKGWQKRREEIRRNPETATTKEVQRLFEESRWLREEMRADDFASVSDFGVLGEIAKELKRDCKQALKGLKGAAAEVNYFGLACRMKGSKGLLARQVIQSEEDRASYVSEQLHHAANVLEESCLLLARVRLMCRKVLGNARDMVGD